MLQRLDKERHLSAASLAYIWSLWSLQWAELVTGRKERGSSAGHSSGGREKTADTSE